MRAIAYAKPGRMRLESRNLSEITAGYPEVRGLLRDLGMREAVLDGELVAFDDDGRPSFERLQRRMHVTAPSAVKRLAASTPVVYAIFDLLYLDGHNLMGVPYEQRRERLEQLGLGGPAWRVPAAHPGQRQAAARRDRGTGARGDRRQAAGLPLRAGAADGSLDQDQAHPPPGARDRRLAARRGAAHRSDRRAADGPLRGRSSCATPGGSGPGSPTGRSSSSTPGCARCGASAARSTAPKLPRNAVFVEPELVAEIEFREWTSEGVMRAPSYKGLRDDKPAAEVMREDRAPARPTPIGAGDGTPEALFDEVQRLPDGALAVIVDGRI